MARDLIKAKSTFLVVMLFPDALGLRAIPLGALVYTQVDTECIGKISCGSQYKREQGNRWEDLW
jgi:hypothetical protein